MRREPVARTMVRAWRRLTRGEGVTVVACSGGADSTALLLALWGATSRVVAAHVVHDMRPREESERDRDWVAGFAAKLGVAFVSEGIAARPLGGNLEAACRTARYAALARMAADAGAAWVATGHHAGDQAETVLMRLMRGAGPRGLGGMRAKRVLSVEPRVVQVRPALGVEPAELRDMCARLGVAWVEDATNADVTRVRAAVRQGVLPALVGISPRALERIGVAAELCAESAAVVRGVAEAAFAKGVREAGGVVFARAEMRALPAVVVGECVRMAAEREGRRDRLSWRVVRPVAEAIRDGKEHRREFRVGSSWCVVDAARILIRAHEENER